MSLPEGTPGNRKVSRVVAFLVMVEVAVLLGQLNTEAAEMDGIWGKVMMKL